MAFFHSKSEVPLPCNVVSQALSNGSAGPSFTELRDGIADGFNEQVSGIGVGYLGSFEGSDHAWSQFPLDAISASPSAFRDLAHQLTGLLGLLSYSFNKSGDSFQSRHRSAHGSFALLA